MAKETQAPSPPSENDGNVEVETEVVARDEADDEQGAEPVVNVNIKTLGGGSPLSVPVGLGDTIMDVRHFLTESPETCHYTHYQLRHEGCEVNDFTEVSSLMQPEQDTPVLLQMAEACYEERAVRAHVRRLREVLAPPAVTPASAVYPLLPVVSDGNIVPSPLDKEAMQPALSSDNDEEGGPIETTSLLPLFDSDLGADLSLKDLPLCLKAISLSSLNPPPPNRKLQGDLLYYDVVMSDDRTCCVTASARGFYVNKTISGEPLNPAKDGGTSTHYTLAGLLSQVSPAFSRNFKKLIALQAHRDPFEPIPKQLASFAWAALPTAHTMDASRAEDAVANAFGMEVGALTRDWNEEHQSSRELPKGNRRERILRERTMFKISCDFMDAATKGAVGVIDKSIPPINPMDPPAAYMYVYNSIFFSYATETKEPPLEDGLGDQATYASANQDLLGVTHYSMTEVEGLHTLATAIIDYRGSRVVAQSIIPGILQGEQLHSLIHGSVDNGNKYVWNEAFHDKLRQAASKLFIREHPIVDGAGDEHSVCVAVESKGIIGSDNRTYLLDLVRFTPHDPNYKGDQPDAGLLRWELVRRYCVSKQMAQVRQIQADRKAAGDGEVKEGQEAAGGEGEKQDEVAAWSVNVNVIPSSEVQASVQRSWKAAGATAEEDAKEVEAAAAMLTETVIPSMVDRFRSLELSPVDGRQLTEALHAQGVNVRYLGAVHRASGRVPYVQALCEREMVARAAKTMIRAGLHRTGPSHLAAACAHVLNCLLGHVSAGSGNGSHEKKTKKKRGAGPGRGAAREEELDPRGPLCEWCSNSLWQALQAEVKRKFDFDLADDADETLQRLRKLPLLRAVAQRVGVQLVARDYDFKSPHPLTSDDILQLFPVARGTISVCKEAQDHLNLGKQYFSVGNLQKAFELLHEALALLHQTCGPMHNMVAQCYGALAMVYYNLQDLGNAMSYQQKAIVILEKISAWDDPEVALGYGNMALFSHCLNHNRRALLYIRRAEYLLLLVCGPNHPDVAALYINTAMIHLDLQHVRSALRYLHAALTINESMLGPDHVSTATSYHATAVALSMMRAAPLAAKNEQKCHDILRALLGEQHPRVQESHHWILQFAARGKLQAQQKQLPLPDDSAMGKETLRPVVFANGGAREAEKNVPAVRIAPPKKGKRGGKAGRGVDRLAGGGNGEPVGEIAVQ